MSGETLYDHLETVTILIALVAAPLFIEFHGLGSARILLIKFSTFTASLCLCVYAGQFFRAALADRGCEPLIRTMGKGFVASSVVGALGFLMATSLHAAWNQ